MRRSRRYRLAHFALALGLATAVGCGRSERVGWADREMPDSVAGRAGTALGDVDGATDVAAEHERLSAALLPLKLQALEDPALAAGWAALRAETEARVAERSEFHRELIERRKEIEALMASSGAASDTLSSAQRSELARYYGNIQRELSRVEMKELRGVAYAERFKEFQTALFAKMRELAPERATEIDRLERLETRLLLIDGTLPPAPGARPGR